ncbi:MerR family transcriptional regulator [Kineosporia sp. J2-2]|uniref:MerR family transcriptional regulator n=1 Tax=Kineosporia corallincola TaxID=2835133 RepID=A0ABS5TLL4_9ACTN|nr:MerR family transcriptional regulator [Kineosporia corallincola]MBT0771995.1 MerR family transcriptional regulator [Kineosporia corallincola]
MSEQPAVGIRDVSERTGISVDTLRWYEREGLIPEVGRGTDGRRRYTPAVLRWVRTVQALRRTGMPVAEVREFVQAGPQTLERHRYRLALLERQSAAIDEQLARLTADRSLIGAKIESYRQIVEAGMDCEDPAADRLADEVFARWTADPADR